MARVRLTKRVLDALDPGELVWDTDVRGFGARCQTKRRIFLLKTELRGQPRWFTIGEIGAPWTVDTARAEAQRLWGLIRSGEDIAAIRDADHDKTTVTQLCQRYLEEHAYQHKKPKSAAVDAQNIANHIIPVLGKMRVTDVSRNDVDAFKRAVREGKSFLKLKTGSGRIGPQLRGGSGVANRCLSLLSKMFNLAEQWNYRPENTNPCRLIQRYAEKRSQRFLTTEELNRLGAALNEAETDGSTSAYAIATFRLLLLTGARLGEITTLRWEHVDLQRGLLLLPDSKTGQKSIHLSKMAVELLANLPRRGASSFVIVGAVDGKPMINVRKPWLSICARAGLHNVRIHDLRHSFASIAAASGASLLMIGKLLGHTQPQTTARYAHLVADPVQTISETVGAALATSLGPRK